MRFSGVRKASRVLWKYGAQKAGSDWKEIVKKYGKQRGVGEL